MMDSTLPDLVRLHKAMAHPVRLRILAMLHDGELCVCQIIAVIGQAGSTISAHLAVLRNAGLIQERKEGRWVYSRLSDDEGAAGVFESLWLLIANDPQIVRDQAVCRQLRTVPPADLCRADLDISRLGIDTSPQTRNVQSAATKGRS